MRFVPVILLLIVGLFSCNQADKIPDVNHIKIKLNVQRFEKDLFSLDSTAMETQLDQLIARYPSFGENFLTTILNADPRWGGDTAVNYINGFIHSYRPVYDTAQKVFADFSPWEKEIREGLQFLQYYFPKYKAPHNIITYIGPLDGYGDILSEDAFIIGLHHHLGAGYSQYQSSWMQETYPAYISSRFTPDYIAVNCMKNVITDAGMFPEKKQEASLMVQMVEKGKRLYLLSKLLPYTEEHKLIGYTEKQLKDCYEHEATIWNLFVQNNFLQTIDNNLIKNYVGESPKTQELGESAPGNIGSFAGWQIVKKYMQKQPDLRLEQLMAMDAEKIFSEAKYKP